MEGQNEGHSNEAFYEQIRAFAPKASKSYGL